MRVSRLVLASFMWLVGAATIQAQPERYELGRRLREFEAAWERQTDAEARRKAVPLLDRAVQTFFSFRLAEAARLMDQARFELLDPKPTADARWATSLVVKPETRFLDAAAPHLRTTLEPFYPAKESDPKDLVLRQALLDAHGMKVAGSETKVPLLPHQETLPTVNLPEGDFTLRYELCRDDAVLADGRIMIARAERIKERLAALRAAAESGKDAALNVEAATLRHHVNVLTKLAEGTAPETDYPAHRLLVEAETLAKVVAKNERYFDAQRTGEFWLAVPVDKTTAVVRIWIPEADPMTRPRPLVVALHGAGGSENMFFDTYGNGLVTKLARDRKWIVVAPRQGGGNLPRLVEELAKMYPVDPKRVFAVGHSMGCAQAMNFVSQSPRTFAAVAGLGGGGRVRGSDDLREVAFFVGVGVKDFALGGARGLRNQLQQLKVSQLVSKEYPDIEHLVIVQHALPDVFKFFDEVAAKR